MINHSRWRDQQLNSFAKTTDNVILEQEQVMLDFVTSVPNITWRWLGNNTKFKNFCQTKIKLSDSNYQGVIIFGGLLNNMTSNKLIANVKRLVGNLDYAYVGINRYEVGEHDVDIDLPDTIEDSLDLIMKQCHPGFFRLHTFKHVDGNHMIAAHPMDCYGLCK